VQDNGSVVGKKKKEPECGEGHPRMPLIKLSRGKKLKEAQKKKKNEETR